MIVAYEFKKGIVHIDCYHEESKYGDSRWRGIAIEAIFTTVHITTRLSGKVCKICQKSFSLTPE